MFVVSCLCPHVYACMCVCLLCACCAVAKACDMVWADEVRRASLPQPVELRTSPVTTAKVVAGRIIKSRPVAGALMRPISDVSYLGDKAGHNLNAYRSSSHIHPTPIDTPQKQTDRLGLPLPPLVRRASTTDDIDTTPASRADAIAVADSVREALGVLGENADPIAESAVWMTAFAEITRQVSVHCAERGEVLDALRLRTKALFGQFEMQAQEYQDQIAALGFAHEQMSQTAHREMSEKSKHARFGVLFQRALVHGTVERTRKVVEEEQHKSRRGEMQRRPHVCAGEACRAAC
jgi:hypothetical protein